jgi:hypothetical protein
MHVVAISDSFPRKTTARRAIDSKHGADEMYPHWRAGTQFCVPSQTFAFDLPQGALCRQSPSGHCLNAHKTCKRTNGLTCRRQTCISTSTDDEASTRRNALSHRFAAAVCCERVQQLLLCEPLNRVKQTSVSGRVCAGGRRTTRRLRFVGAFTVNGLHAVCSVARQKRSTKMRRAPHRPPPVARRLARSSIHAAGKLPHV